MTEPKLPEVLERLAGAVEAAAALVTEQRAESRRREYEQRRVPRLGSQSELRQVNFFLTALEAMAELETQTAYQRVPEQYVKTDVDDDTLVATVICPCGEEHLVELGSDRTADCNRHFVFYGSPHRHAVYAMRFAEDS